MDQRERKIQERFRKQERMIGENLNLSNHPEFTHLDERITLAQYIEALDQAQLSDIKMLFTPDDQGKELSPLNLPDFIAKLLQDSRAICEMATVLAPVWTYDRISAFIHDMEKLLPFADTAFKQNFVLLLKIISDAEARSDVVALEDLFYGEVPALIRTLQKTYHKDA